MTWNLNCGYQRRTASTFNAVNGSTIKVDCEDRNTREISRGVHGLNKFSPEDEENHGNRKVHETQLPNRTKKEPANLTVLASALERADSSQHHYVYRVAKQ